MKGIDIHMIAAIDTNGAIGSNNEIPWSCPADMRRFVHLTTGKVVIMGRKTAMSLKRPLKGRTNLVLTRDPKWHRKGFIPVHDAWDVRCQLKKAQTKELWVIGGGDIYRKYINQASTIHLTQLALTIDNPDAFFPMEGLDQFPSRYVIPTLDPRITFWTMERVAHRLTDYAGVIE